MKFMFIIKKLIFLAFLGIFIFGTSIIGCTSEINSSQNIKIETVSSNKSLNQPNQKENGVSVHGTLNAVNGKIIDKNGNPIVLKGMSTHGIVWFPNFINKYSIQKTKEYGANVFRTAMYTEEYGGYTTGEAERQNSKNLMYQSVDNTISLDMYAVIDWHILNDSNPQKHKEEAINFFDEVSKKYAGNPAVIYEICNEPHNVSWKNDIKPYAEEIIKVIRKNSPQALILVGSNTWSQDIDEASEDLLEFENIAYTFHFYAGTHSLNDFKPKIEKALQNGATIFVSEWGTTKSNGSDGIFLKESNDWIYYLNQKQISHINWSLCDKSEASAALLSGSNSENWDYNNLTESGKFVFNDFSKP